MLNILKNTINRVFASGVDSDASAFITATGLSGTTQKSAITTLVKDLKSSGLWSKMKAVYPMVTDNRNLLSYTEDFTNGIWNKYSSTITANATTAPNGTLTADLFYASAAGDPKYVQLVSPITISAGSITQSIYAKYNGIPYLYMDLYEGADYFVWFNIQNGTVGTIQSGSGITASIQDVGNGWYRCIATRTFSGTTNYASYRMSNADNSIVATQSGTNGIYIWGAQVEQGSTASTYQPILTTPSAFMASQMKYNLKDARDLDAAFRLTWSGGWTYSSNGATTNGTNSFADTKLNPLSTLATSYPSFGVYWRNTFSTGQTNIMGCCNTTTVNRMDLGFDVGVTVPFVATSSNPSDLGTATSNTGYICATRQGANVSKLFRNGAILINGVQTFTANPNYNFYLAARNEGGTTSYYSNNQQIAFAHIGNSLTDQDTLLLNQIVEKYQVALSRGVQAAQSFYYNSAYSNEANTYLYSTQITGTTQVSAINTLINGLKANNLWSKMKAVYPFVTDYRNLLGYTEDYSNAVWSKNNSSIAVNQITAPNGTLTGNGLVDNATNAGHSFNNATGITVTANNYTLSVYAKKGNKDWIYLNIYNGTNDAFAWFNLNTGITGTVQSGLTSSIQDAGNGWYRVSITRNLPVTSNCYVQYGASNTDNSTIFVGTGTYNIYLWGTQFELGALSNYQQVLTTSANYMSNQMKFNMANPQDSDAAFRLAFSGGWTYSTNGAQPNGTNGYADTKFNLSSNFSTREQSYSLYTQASNSNANVLAGVTDGSSPTQFYNGTGQFNILSTLYAKGSSFSNGCILMTSTLSAISAFEKAIKIGTTSGSTYSAVNYNYYIGARNNVGTSDFFADRRYSFAHIGNTLTDAEAILFSQIIQQFQTDLSRQV